MAQDWTQLASAVEPGWVVVTGSGEGRLEQVLLDGRHQLRADEPVAVGGTDRGPSPYELLLMALGSCTAMTLRLYADRKGWKLDQAIIRLRHFKEHAKDCADCETKTAMIDRIEKRIELQGTLDEEQRRRLMQIADMCPVHRTLEGKVVIASELVATSAG
jgi:uncharacterized OsmC-like protein